MKKRISFATQGFRAYSGDCMVNHLIPNRYADAVGPFIFLDELAPKRRCSTVPAATFVNNFGTYPHASLDYTLDSAGGHRPAQFRFSLAFTQIAGFPGHFAVHQQEIPKKMLDDEAGWLKVISGEYEDLVSGLPFFPQQFLYHILLNCGKHFSISINSKWDCAAFLPFSDAVINDIKFKSGEFLMFNYSMGAIDFSNTSQSPLDIIVFGGRPGPF